MKTIGRIDSEVVVIKAQDSNRDIVTNSCSMSVPNNIDLSKCQPTYKIEIMCWCKGNVD